MTAPPGTEAVFVAPAAAAPVRGRALWRGSGLALIAAVLLLWPQLVHDEFLYHVGTLLCLYAIGATSVHLIIRTATSRWARRRSWAWVPIPACSA